MKSYDTIQKATPSLFQPTPKTHPLHHINVSTLTIAINTMNLKTHNTLHASTYTSEIHDAWFGCPLRLKGCRIDWTKVQGWISNNYRQGKHWFGAVHILCQGRVSKHPEHASDFGRPQISGTSAWGSDLTQVLYSGVCFSHHTNRSDF